VQRARRALAVEPGETALVAWSALTLFLIEWASVAVSNASDTMFLKRVGVDYVPIVFLANSLLLTATTLAAGNLAARYDLKRLLTGTFCALSILLFVLWGLVLAGVPSIPTTLVILSKQIDVIAALMFWTVVAGLMTSRQGKRLVGLMTAGGTFGTILGSFSSGIFGRLLGIPSLLAVAGVAFAFATLASIPLGASAQRRLYRRGAPPAPDQDQRPHIVAFWKESSLFRVLALTSFLAGVLGPMLYYSFSCAADLATRTADGEQRLLSLYGALRGWINVGVLVVQVGGSAMLFRRIGVPLAATVAPAAYVFGLTGLGVAFGLPTAMPATTGTGVLDHTIYEPAQRILSALLPLKIRVAATSVIQGPAKRAGAALGSLLVLAVIATVHDPSWVAIVGLPIAGGWLLLALSLWQNYSNLLLEAARVPSSDANAEDARASLLDTSTLRTLEQNLVGSDIARCQAACDLFEDAPPVIAIEALTRALSSAPMTNHPMLLETLDHVLADTAVDTSGGDGDGWPALPGGAAVAAVARNVANNLVRVLESSDHLIPSERAKLLHILGRASIGRAVPDTVREALEQARTDQTPPVALAAEVANMRAGLVESNPDRLEEIVGAALEGDDAAARAIALAELRFELLRGDDRESVWNRRLKLLMDHLARAAALPASHAPAGNGSKETTCAARGCAEAIDALADVALGHREAIARCAPVVIALADDEDVEVRRAVLRFIGNSGLAGHARLLAERLSSRSAVESQAAREALETLGPAAADALLYALRHGSRKTREYLPAMLREIRVDRDALKAVIDRELQRSHELLMLVGVLEASAVSKLVLQRLRERVDESLRVALELVATTLEDDRITNVCRSLGRAWNMRDRAVLLEALEALLPPDERSRLLPLLEEHGAQRLAATAAHALGRRLPTMEEAIAAALESHDPLTTGLIVATVDHELLARVAPWLDLDAALRVFSERRPQHGPGRVTVDGATAGSAAEDAGTAGAGSASAGTASAGTASAGIASAGTASVGGKERFMLSQVETMLHLRALDLFDGLTTRQLAELARVAREIKVPAGSTIVAEGEFDDRMYFIVSGNVRITKAGQTVAELGARDFFGEMAVFDGETRSATATTTEETWLLLISRDDLFEVMEDQPAIAIGICQTLVRRVRAMLNERSVASATSV